MSYKEILNEYFDNDIKNVKDSLLKNIKNIDPDVKHKLELMKKEYNRVMKIKKDIDKKHKTPLRYAGGKSKAIYKLEKHLPDNMYEIEEIHDCFLGGGSFPLYLTKLYPDKIFRLNDIYEPLYNFWIQLRDNGKDMSDKLLVLKKNITQLKKQKSYLINRKNV